MLGLNYPGTCTCPANTTGIIKCCEGDFLIENSCMGVIAILYLYNVILDVNVFGVFANDVVLIGQTSFGVISRPNATIHEVLSDSRFSAS